MLSNTILDLNSSSTPGVEPYDAWLSSLPQEVAFQMVTARYITVGTFAVSFGEPIGFVILTRFQIFVWEILINICNDYILLFEHQLRLPTVVYFASR